MFLVILLLTIVMLEITNVQKVVCVDASQECNGTSSSIGGCLADADEFMMESETNAMLLANVKRISNRALQKPQLCRAEKIACGVGASLLECNGTTRIGECIADHGDEYLMESEMSTMILAGNGETTISFLSLQKPMICDATEYSSCIGAQKNVAQRSCGKFNRCEHDPRKK
ncbi:hypothetical protein CQW23_05450 [Capsicum baccatum]|uniref:Uncharacterized protein n=1 Tax=Capsicum baccatum TaxID=33114 RepID=A0A2G2XHI8_CAPBA|nr:hypothetical protein CQW23_05450 [Capsicum baccatum]